jgi:GntR family phosphonate transport system transcriptional regulator
LGRPALWTSIRDHLADEIAKGHYAPGDRLPTEAQLAGRFGVNRHTVRRALAALSETGAVHSRRGAGVFVQHRQMPYPIGKRVRFHQNLLAAGRVPEKRILMLQTRAASPQEAEALGLPKGPACMSTRAEPVRRGAHRAVPVRLSGRTPARMLDALRETGSVTAAFAAHGIDDYTRAHTEITAKPADATLAAQLRLSPGAPILRSVGVNVDADRARPLEYGRTWFAGDRVTLTLGADAP